MYMTDLDASSTTESVSMHLRNKLFRATMKQDIAFFDETDNSTGALTSAISHKPQQINSAAGMTTAAILQSIFTLSVGLIIALIVGMPISKTSLSLRLTNPFSTHGRSHWSHWPAYP